MSTESGKCKCPGREPRAVVIGVGVVPGVLPSVAVRKRRRTARKRKIFAREVGDLPPVPCRSSKHSYRLVTTRTRATRVTRSTRGTLATRSTRSTRDTLAGGRGGGTP